MILFDKAAPNGAGPGFVVQQRIAFPKAPQTAFAGNT